LNRAMGAWDLHDRVTRGRWGKRTHYRRERFSGHITHQRLRQINGVLADNRKGFFLWEGGDHILLGGVLREAAMAEMSQVN